MDTIRKSTLPTLHFGSRLLWSMPRELVARRKDGSIFPIDLSVTEVDHSGFFTGIIRDRSDRKQLQRHILEISSEEQRRIGLELQDGTGQELTRLSLTQKATKGTKRNKIDFTPHRNTIDSLTTMYIEHVPTE